MRVSATGLSNNKGKKLCRLRYFKLHLRGGSNRTDFLLVHCAAHDNSNIGFAMRVAQPSFHAHSIGRNMNALIVLHVDPLLINMIIFTPFNVELPSYPRIGMTNYIGIARP